MGMKILTRYQSVGVRVSVNWLSLPKIGLGQEEGSEELD